MKRHIKKISKGYGVCMACGKHYNRTDWYSWHSLFDGSLIHEKICKKCAKREAGSKYWDRVK